MCAGDLPFREKVKVWEVYNLVQRAEEQKVKVQRDAAAFVRYYHEVEQQLNDADVQHGSWLGTHADGDEVQAGLQALKLSGIGFVRSQLHQGEALQQQIGVPPA